MMFSCKVKTLYLLLSSLVLFKLNNGLSLSRSKRSPLEIAVLSPSEFDIRLPEGTLLNFRVNINKELNSDGVADFEKNKTDGPILHFSRDGLNLKGGDNIYYHGTFENDGTYQGEDGVYIFDGVFKASKKTKREVIEGNQDDSNTKTIESRSGHHEAGGTVHRTDISHYQVAITTMIHLPSNDHHLGPHMVTLTDIHTVIHMTIHMITQDMVLGTAVVMVTGRGLGGITTSPTVWIIEDRGEMLMMMIIM